MWIIQGNNGLVPTSFAVERKRHGSHRRPYSGIGKLTGFPKCKNWKVGISDSAAGTTRGSADGSEQNHKR